MIFQCRVDENIDVVRLTIEPMGKNGIPPISMYSTPASFNSRQTRTTSSHVAGLVKFSSWFSILILPQFFR
ncbi:hypothetical protein LFML04_0530 [Leptospirillum ferriphilum ML-04]|uniref:Uncharacterized protein n=1 Tax=Leptospirillum ferriphilum (strain ML-04) TaxID=1048260 RepID=J9ZAP0_LEPFM|nr:hypothetical protein LFML04_0530 [Leptospirillum ferriphilum ML-04]